MKIAGQHFGQARQLMWLAATPQKRKNLRKLSPAANANPGAEW
jgi:hypothetical protein